MTPPQSSPASQPSLPANQTSQEVQIPQADSILGLTVPAGMPNWLVALVAIAIVADRAAKISVLADKISTSVVKLWLRVKQRDNRPPSDKQD
jgi:hypothetical protein